jgi:hypothetical protein
MASKRGPRSSDRLSADSPAFPLIPLAYIAWKSHCMYKENCKEIKLPNVYNMEAIMKLKPSKMKEN